MHDIPSPLDHLAAFILVFALGALATYLWNMSLRLLMCRQSSPAFETSQVG